MRARGGSNYGAEDAHLFLDKIVPAAPDIEIVVAHLGASGPGYPPQNDEVMAVFAAAAERKDPRMNNLYFDVATNVTDEITPADASARRAAHPADRPRARALRIRPQSARRKHPAGVGDLPNEGPAHGRGASADREQPDAIRALTAA